MIVTEAELRLMLGLAASITDEERGILATVHREAEAAVRKFIGFDPEYAERTIFLSRGDAYGGGNSGDWETTDSHAVFQLDDIANELIVPHVPIRSIGDLRVDRDGRFGTRAGSFGSDTAWVEGVDFYPVYEMAGVCRSGILKAFTSWPSVAGSVKLTYTAGLTPDELAGATTNRLLDGSGIVEAVKLTAVRGMEVYMSRRKKSRVGWTPGNVVAENLGDYGYSVDSSSAQASAGMVRKMPPQAEQAAQEWKHYGVVSL